MKDIRNRDIEREEGQIYGKERNIHSNKLWNLLVLWEHEYENEDEAPMNHRIPMEIK